MSKKFLYFLFIIFFCVSSFSEVLDINFVTTANEVVLILTLDSQAKVSYYGKNENRTVHYFIVDSYTKSTGYLPVSSGTVEGVQIVPLEGKVNLFVYTLTPVNATYSTSGMKIYIRFPYSMSKKRLTASFMNIKSDFFFKDLGEFFNLNVVLYDSARNKNINIKANNSSIEDIIRMALVSTNLSYAYSTNETLYFGSAEEIQKNFAAFWQIYDGQVNVEKLREIIGYGAYAGFSKDKSKLFVYGGVNEYKLLAEALVVPKKEEWYYISYTVSDSDIKEIMSKVAKIYNLTADKYEILEWQKKIAVKTPTPWDIENLIKQLSTKVQQKKWYYVNYTISDEDIKTVMNEVAKIYGLSDKEYEIMELQKKVALLLDDPSLVSQIENIIKNSKRPEEVKITYSAVDVSYPERVAEALKILYPNSSPNVVSGRLYVVSGYEKMAQTLAKDSMIGNPWRSIFDDIPENVAIASLEYLGVTKENYDVKTLGEKTIVTFFASEQTYKRFLQFIDFVGNSSYLVKADDEYLKKFNVTVLQRFSDGTKLVSGRIKEIERLKKAISEEVIAYIIHQLPTDPSAEIFSKITGYPVEVKDGYLIFTVSKFDLEKLKTQIQQIRKSYGSSILVLGVQYKQEVIETAQKIYNVTIYQLEDNLIISGTLANDAKSFLEKFSTKDSMSLDVAFQLSQSHIDYITKVFNVQVEYFSTLKKIFITGSKENVSKAVSYVTSLSSSDIVTSLKITENLKKDDIDRVAKLLSVDVETEQVNDIVYLKGSKTDVQKIKDEIEKLTSDPNNKYKVINYPAEIDNLIKSRYKVETYKTEQGFLVFGSEEKLKQIEEFVSGLSYEDKIIQNVAYPDEFDNIIKSVFKVETYKMPTGYLIIGTKQQIENVKTFVANIDIPETTYEMLKYPDELNELIKQYFKVNTYKTSQGYLVFGTKDEVNKAKEMVVNLIKESSDTVVSLSTGLEGKDIETIISVFDSTVKYFKVGDKLYLSGKETSINKIKEEILTFKPKSEYNFIDKKLLIDVSDKNVKQLVLDVAKLLSEEIIVLEDIKQTCSMRIVISDFESLLNSLKSFNVSYEVKNGIYFVFPTKELLSKESTQTETSTLKETKQEEITVENGHITINVSNKNVGEIISQIMIKLGKSYKLDKIDAVVNSMYLKDIDYETFKQIFSTWANFTEIGGLTYISPKIVVSVDPKRVSVKDGTISVRIDNEPLSNVIKTVFEELGYHVVFSKPIDKTATMSISNVDFDTFNSIMLNYGIFIKKSGNVYIVDTTPEATKVRTTYTFNVPRNADKVEELIKFYGGKTMVSPAAGVIVAYDLDPKNVDDINKLISEFTSAKIVSIEARIIDESQASGLSAEIVTLFKSGNYVSFGSDGLKLNISILDILDGTVLDKILNEAQVSFETKSAEGLAPKANNGLSKLLANPNIMTKSGEEARIFIGDTVPVKIATTSGGQTNVEIRNLEGGIELKIIPYVNSDNTIDLELSTSVSNFDYSIVIDGLPKINKREAKTKITIKDGQTLVIGGLAREEKSKAEWKVPILGDLPIIGMLFKGMKETVEQRNITIFLTAKIIELGK